MHVNIIGMGMGNRESLTVGALEALERSELVVGARRLLEACAGLPAREKLPLVSPHEIREALEERHGLFAEASILVSGDVGFFSLAPLLYSELSDFPTTVFPGVSSLGYLCSRLRMPWQDVHVLSVHGREANYAGEVRTRRAVFLLTGGSTRVEDVCRGLAEAGLGSVTVHVGENLSYPDERIVSGTAAELAEASFCDLSVMLVINDQPLERPFAAPSTSDEDFARGAVPMTKSEIRALAIARLRLQPSSVLWDVGAGTGSVSIEGALAASRGQVFAIERAPEAVDLIKRNAANFNATNITVIEGEAPQALCGLPAPDRVFVGGSGGSLEGVLRAATEANPAVGVVISAVTLETVAEALRCMALLSFENVDITQVQVSKASPAGTSHLMKAHNPVYLISATGGAQR